tara:strand:- start:325 stop:597 length:273 start_codon:yes stop_codon:yes gene_type:complete
MALNQEQKRRKKFLVKKGSFAESVSNSDTVDLSEEKAELYIGTGGHIQVNLFGGSTVTLKNVPSGTYLQGIFVTRVYRTGTTARDIVAIY